CPTYSAHPFPGRAAFSWEPWPIKDSHTTSGDGPQAQRVCPVDGIITHVIVEIDTTTKPHWILAQESSRARIVVASIRMVEAGLRIELPTRVANRIGRCPIRCGQVSISIIGIRVRDRAG